MYSIQYLEMYGPGWARVKTVALFVSNNTKIERAPKVQFEFLRLINTLDGMRNRKVE
jgi:hypothetical protein